jgi:hypothetical protein
MCRLAPLPDEEVRHPGWPVHRLMLFDALGGRGRDGMTYVGRDDQP